MYNTKMENGNRTPARSTTSMEQDRKVGMLKVDAPRKCPNARVEKQEKNKETFELYI